MIPHALAGVRDWTFPVLSGLYANILIQFFLKSRAHCIGSITSAQLPLAACIESGEG